MESTYDELPFVYETYNTVTTTPKKIINQPIQFTKNPLVIEERGETDSGTNVFTISDVYYFLIYIT